MDWTQALTIIGISVTGFLYILNRMDRKFEKVFERMEVDKQDTDHKIESAQKENNAKFESMNGRFNGLENRLTAIEVESKNINQRLSSIEAENKDIGKRLSIIEGALSPRKVFHFEEHYKGASEEPKEN